jgi:hypothetical protein
MAKVPPLKQLNIFDREAPGEILKALVSVAGTLGGAIGAYVTGNLAGVLTGAVSALLLSMLGAWLGVKAWRRDQQRSSMQHADLWGCVHVVHSILASRVEGDEPALRLRTVLHVVIHEGGSPIRYQQATHYAGAPGGESGREFAANVGVVGAVIQSGQARIFGWHGADPVRFRGDMMRQFHYTEAEAEKLIKSQRSWMGIPLKDATGKLFAVVYCDACLPGAFNENHANLLADAIEGIVQFAEERFR